MNRVSKILSAASLALGLAIAGVPAIAQQAPPPEPQQIEKGQTPEQVKAALGPPEKIVNLGAKQLYVYHDIKVTFLNGKVSDVQ